MCRTDGTRSYAVILVGFCNSRLSLVLLDAISITAAMVAPLWAVVVFALAVPLAVVLSDLSGTNCYRIRFMPLTGYLDKFFRLKCASGSGYIPFWFGAAALVFLSFLWQGRFSH